MHLLSSAGISRGYARAAVTTVKLSKHSRKDIRNAAPAVNRRRSYSSPLSILLALYLAACTPTFLLTPEAPETWDAGYARGIDTYGVTRLWSAWGHQYLAMSVLRGTPEHRIRDWSPDPIAISDGQVTGGRLQWNIFAHSRLMDDLGEVPDSEWNRRWHEAFQRYDDIIASQSAANWPPLQATLHLMPSEFVGSHLASHRAPDAVPLELWIAFPSNPEQLTAARDQGILTAIRIVAHEHLHVLLAESGTSSSLSPAQEEALAHRWGHCVTWSLNPELYEEWAEGQRDAFAFEQTRPLDTVEAARDVVDEYKAPDKGPCLAFRASYQSLMGMDSGP